MYRFLLAIGVALAIVWNCGCSGPPPKGLPPATSVKGTVNMDGKPVPTGEIHFSVLGAPPSLLKITDGTFSGEAPIGNDQVEVYIYVDGPPNPKYPGVPIKVNIVPNKYWGARTVLKATVKAGERNEFNFDITAK